MLGGEKARGLPTAGQTSDCGRGCEPAVLGELGAHDWKRRRPGRLPPALAIRVTNRGTRQTRRV